MEVTRNQIHVIYIHPHLERIGELFDQIWRLRNIYYDTKRYKITVIHPPIDWRKRTNKTAHKILMKGLNVVHSIDGSLLWPQKIENLLATVVQESNCLYVLLSHPDLTISFAKKYYRKKPEYYCSLTDQELEMGYRLRDKLNIPRSSPIVTLHVRGPEYTSDTDIHNYRNMNIENYIPAINFLIDKGFYIIRLGDKGMKRIVNAPSQFIDAPFHPAYNEFVDPYFIAISNFYIGCPSGPVSVARAFNVPILSVNTIAVAAECSADNELLLYKKWYSFQLKRNLTYEEMITSSCMSYYVNECFLKSDIELIENSPEEILVGIKEIIARLNNTYLEDDEVNRRVNNIRERVHFSRRHILHKNIQFKKIPCLPLFFLNAKISHEFIKLNPSFLGHKWEYDISI